MQNNYDETVSAVKDRDKELGDLMRKQIDMLQCLNEEVRQMKTARSVR
jgi:hypothetical protein